jgi:hypothetical protein
MANEFITDVVDPVELTGFVRELVDGDLPYRALFPPLRTDDMEYELTNVDVSTAGEVARYRAWDTSAKIGKRPGLSVIQGEIPPLAWGYRLNEKELARFDRLRAGVAERSDQRVVDVIFNDAERAARAVQNRLTLAHGSLLTSGDVVLTELGDVEATNELKATFAVPAAQGGTTAVSPSGADWSDTTNAVPVVDLKAWEVIYRANNGGRNPDAWGVSSEVMADLALNASIRTLAGGSSGVTPGVITDEVVRQVVRAAGVNAPIVVMFDVERPTLTSGTPARVVGNRFVIGVRAGMGSTLFSAPPAQAGLVRSGATQLAQAEPGIIAYQTGSIDPAWVKTTAEGLAIPVLRDPNALFIATV